METYCDSNYFFKKLGDLLKYKTSLESISITGLPGSTKVKVLSTLVESIAQQQELKFCSLQYLRTSDQGMIELGSALSKLNTLERLRIEDLDTRYEGPNVADTVSTIS